MHRLTNIIFTDSLSLQALHVDNEDDIYRLATYFTKIQIQNHEKAEAGQAAAAADPEVSEVSCNSIGLSMIGYHEMHHLNMSYHGFLS